MQLLLRVDGQNFCNTILDTGELSVLRGGVRALLYAPEELFEHLNQHGFPNQPFYYGSSEGVTLVEVPDGQDAAAYQGELESQVREFLAGRVASADPIPQAIQSILPYLTLSFAVRPYSGDFPTENRTLLNQNRTRQYQSLSVDCLPPQAQWLGEKPSEFDHVRPVGQEDGRVKKVVKRDPETQKADEFLVSHSVKARQSHGHDLRQLFYIKELSPLYSDGTKPPEAVATILDPGQTVIRFANSFREIVKANKVCQAPEALHQKMAVLYADGNDFGKLKAKHCKSGEDHGRFSGLVLHGRRRLLAAMVQAAFEQRFNLERNGRRETVIPMETLLWGGDEFCVVFPACLALTLLETIEPMLKGLDWMFEGQRLTHSLGLVICPDTTPIREVRRLADELADSVKGLRDIQGRAIGRKGNYLQYMVLLGMDPPPEGPEYFRQQHFHCTSPRPFTLDFNDGFRLTLLPTLRSFLGLDPRSQGVPPSQLFALREMAVRDNVLGHDELSPAFRTWSAAVDEKLKSYQYDVGKAFSWSLLAKPEMGYDPEHPVIPLMHLLTLRDYVDAEKNGKV